MTGLEFSFQEMITEVDSFSRLSEKFVTTESRGVLQALKRSLENYRAEPTEGSLSWQISEHLPLRTVISQGKYEKGGNGAHHLYAEISAVWEIQRMRERKLAMPAKRFKLIGLASTRIRVLCEPLDEAPAREIAMWRMEIGDDNSPGCHFHIQVLGAEEFPFPKSLPIPRFPGLIMTPAAATEFVLAELFQDEWASHVSRGGADLDRWRPIQKSRWEKLLNWKLRMVAGSASPWTAIKSAKPEPGVFIGA